jgi:phage gp29-like protein
LGNRGVHTSDTTHIRLRLDAYFNVVAVVNMVRGLEPYAIGDYLVYTHNGLYNSPFGQSDGRAAITAARMISDVYKLWYVALKVYGLPYMVGKTSAQNKAMMSDALRALRAGGWATLTGEKDTIEAINLAAGAALNGFESFIHTKREDIFFAVRNVAQPFMEGDGGSDSHTDTGVQQGASNAGEKFKAHQICAAIQGQLIPWLMRPNFALDESEYPQVKLGGTDWNQNSKIIATIKEAREAGLDPSKKWAQAQIAMEGATSDDDRLVSPQEKQQQQQAAAAPAIPGVPAPAAAPAPAPAATFSADHAPAGGIDPAQVARVVDQLVRELVA